METGNKLYKHQEKYASGYKDKELVVHEGGTGKTICACVWLKDGRDNNALVICPKRVVKKWEKALSDWGVSPTTIVLSKETFKKYPIKKWSAIVVDEADEFASPLFVGKKRSQLSTALYNLIKTHDMPTLLLTATPIRSHPWNLHTLLCFIGKYIDHRQWRESFFSLERRPYLPYPAWLPKADWREKARAMLEKNSDIVLFKDCVGDLPPMVEEKIKVKSEKFVGPSEWEAEKSFIEEHRWEQKNKAKEILEIGKEYRKVLVVAYYVEQIESLAKELASDKPVFMVHGGVKDQEALLAKANSAEVDECYLIVQASLGAGFDADTFSCVVFASMSYKVRDWVQMKFRVRRIHNLHPVIYKYLLAGRCDRMVYKTIEAGKEFTPSEWNPHATDTTES